MATTALVRLLLVVPIALVLGAAVGAAVVGIVIGGVSDAFAVAQSHFLVAVPFALLGGIPIFVYLRRSGRRLSSTLAASIGMGLAAIPLCLLLMPEAMRPDSRGFLPSMETLLYSAAVELGGAVGGLAFFALADLLRVTPRARV